MCGAPIEGCIVDLDGTLYQVGEVVPGAADAVARLRGAGLKLCFATNTTRSPRSSLVARLAAMGIEVCEQELFTAPVAASHWLQAHGARRVSLLLPELTHEEFSAFANDEVGPDHVVVGDLGEQWSFDRLNTAFRALVAGARLVAIQKNRSWDAGGGPLLDAGPFVAALEYACGQEAVLVGKPSTSFFTTAAASLGLPSTRVLVVGDGVETDVVGGHAAGFRAVSVRTGSFREELLEGLDQQPMAVLDSIAQLPDWMGVR